VHAVVSMRSASLRPGASRPLPAIQRFRDLSYLSAPVRHRARKLEANAPHGCCGQRHSCIVFIDARIVTTMLISKQTSCGVGM
jgi:hypothetical protein